MHKEQKGEKLTGFPKVAVEMGPLLAFLAGYFLSSRIGPVLDSVFATEMFGTEGKEVYTATALFMPAFIVAFVYSFWKERTVSPMLWLSAILVLGFGGLTLVFQSKVFYYMKSTFAYLLFAGLFGGGLLIGRNFLQMLLGDGLHMPDDAWRKLTIRFTALYLALAAGNEILWRTMTRNCVPDTFCSGEKLYVQIETFGFMGLIFVFIMLQAPFISRHMKEEQESHARTGGDGLQAELKSGEDDNNRP